MKGTGRKWLKRKTGKEEKTYMLIGVLKADKENNGTQLIFKTILQEQVLEANEERYQFT